MAYGVGKCKQVVLIEWVKQRSTKLIFKVYGLTNLMEWSVWTGSDLQQAHEEEQVYEQGKLHTSTVQWSSLLGQLSKWEKRCIWAPWSLADTHTLLRRLTPKEYYSSGTNPDEVIVTIKDALFLTYLWLYGGSSPASAVFRSLEVTSTVAVTHVLLAAGGGLAKFNCAPWRAVLLAHAPSHTHLSLLSCQRFLITSAKKWDNFSLKHTLHSCCYCILRFTK